MFTPRPEKFSILPLHPRPVQGHLVDVGILLISPRIVITSSIKRHRFFLSTYKFTLIIPMCLEQHPAAIHRHICENMMRPVPRSSHTPVS